MYTISSLGQADALPITVPDPIDALNVAYEGLRALCEKTYSPQFCDSVLTRRPLIVDQEKTIFDKWYLWLAAGFVAGKILF